MYCFVNSFLVYCFGVIPAFSTSQSGKETHNGKEAADVCGMTVSQYLSANNYNPKHIVVELNEEILPKTEYDSTAIADGDVVEILSFMGGG